MTNSETILGESLSSITAIPDQDANTTVQEVQKPSYFETIVGEGKKFADAETLAKAKLDSDLHIKKLEEENKLLRSKENNYDLILAELEKKQQPTVANNDQAAIVDVKNTNVDFDQLIEDRLTKRELKLIQNQNTKSTWEALAQNYGNLDTAKTVIAELIKTKPYMKAVIDDLGRTNPTAAIQEILAFKAPETIGNKSINPITNLPNVVNKSMPTITWKEASKVMLSDNKKYHSPEFQSMINHSIEVAKKNGQDYYKS